MTSILALGMLAALFGAATVNVSANQGTEDNFGYRWTDSNSPAPSVSFNWVEINTTGTDTGLSGDDSYDGPFSIGFGFDFYGNTYTDFYVTTNGYIKFDYGSSDYGNDPMPSTSNPDNIICAYWDDMYVPGTGGVYYQTVGSSPNQQLVVEFSDVNRLSYYSTYMSYEIILNETGEIWIQYLYLNGMIGSSASVGIENLDGSVGTQYSYNQASLSDNLAILFNLPAISLHPNQSLVGDVGQELTYTVTVDNNQATADSVDITYTSVLGWNVGLYSTYPTLLTDTNGNGVPDTGDIVAGSSVDIQVTVQIPLAPAGYIETTTVIGTSYVNASNYDSAYLSTHVLSAKFDPPHEDTGVDTAEDNRYEWLSVNVSINVTVPGSYTLSAALYTSGWSYINSAWMYPSLSSGIEIVQLLFDGNDIWVNSADGPYNVVLYLYNQTGQFCDSDSYVTNAYVWSDFAPPEAYFVAPHDDYVVDEDSDLYNESLVIVANVEVTIAGTYYVYADLYDGWWNWLGSQSNSTYLDVGTYSLNFVYYSYDLYSNGYTGTYTAYLTLYDSSWDTLDSDTHITDSYSYTIFDPAPGEIYSEWTNSPPAIDGVFSSGEWADAVSEDLIDSDPANDLGSLILVMNNATHLFVCYDVYGDTHEDTWDYSSFAFDTGNDDVATNGEEDQFYVGGSLSEASVHYVWNETWWDYEWHCAPMDSGLPDHEGLAGAMGYGWSDFSAWDHRIFEYSIPLALLGASPGDMLGFVGRSADQPGVQDWWWWDESSWPFNYGSLPPIDEYGNLILSTGSMNVTTDLALSGTMGLNGWYTTSVVVSLTAYGGVGGPDYTMYRINGGSWVTYTAPLTFITSGSYTLDYYSVDMGANVEPTHTVSFKVDAARPVTTATASGTLGENGWYTSVVTVTLSPSDPAGGSGLNVTRYRTGTTGWQTYAGGGLTFNTDGSMTLYYYSVDNASGAEATKSLSIKIDRSLPMTTAVVDDVNFTLAAADQTSGVNNTFYRIDEGSWTPYEGRVTVTGRGNHTVEFRSVDLAGNTEEVQTVYVEVGGSGGTLGGSAIIWIALIGAVIVAVVILLLIMMMKRRRQEQPMYPPPPQTGPPPVQ